MTRRLEAGPVLVTLGALLLLVSLFLDWFEPGITAWDAFEVWDLVLLLLALGCIAGGLGLTVPDVDVVDRRWLPAVVAIVTIIVASQIINPPPAATGQDVDVGAWLALGAAAVMFVGGVLTFGKVGIAFTVEGRDPRRHVSAVDARGPEEQTTDSQEPVAPEAGRGSRLFARSRGEATPEEEPVAARAAEPTGETAPMPESPPAGDPPQEPKQA
jgi:hypothetical protein